MATLVVQPPQTSLRRSTPPPPPLSLNTPYNSNPIPNKHIPYCPPGPSPQSVQSPATPPSSPPLKQASARFSFTLNPPTSFPRISNNPPIYSLDPATLARAIDEVSTRPLPDAQEVFPWLHGLHADNQIQLAFFTARKKALRRTPRCLRGITIVKAGGDLAHSKIKGAIAPEEILSNLSDTKPEFLGCDPRDGFSVRNFQIQASKLAKVSDIIVYGDKSTNPRVIRSLAEKVAQAQVKWKKDLEAISDAPQTFGTFVLSVPFHEFEKRHPELVAVDSDGLLTDPSLDFSYSERAEMAAMTEASAISGTVYQGPTPDFNAMAESGVSNFDIFIETSDNAQLPEEGHLRQKRKDLELSPIYVDFPSSGSLVAPSFASQSEVDGLVRMCQWIYDVTHEEVPNLAEDNDGDIQMSDLPRRHRNVLIHCADGYTESSLLTVAYYMFAEAVPVHEAWLQLHCQKKRNFFAYQTDVTLLTSIQSRLLADSPKLRSRRGRRTANKIDDPAWLARMDGSLPSRILPYMYLGNLTHANNPDLLKALGIKRILSIGEPVSWSPEESRGWHPDNLMYIDRVQDNGIDPLTQEFDRCLAFIGQGKQDNSATLVHCRVGVSRSATICIAEVMSSLGLSFPKAYCFVRARRLNVIIQPHLRFVYELMKWDERLQVQRKQQLYHRKQRQEDFTPVNSAHEDDGRACFEIKSRNHPNCGSNNDCSDEDDGDNNSEEKDMTTGPASGLGIRREMDWPTVCREIASLNRPYSRQ